MANASFLTTTSPQLPPLGFRWVATLHVWLLLAAGCVLGLLSVAAQRIDIRVTAPATGVLLPRQTHLVRSPVSGVVDRVMVAEGDSVNAGDALVHLRSHDLQHHLELLDADVETQFRRELLLRAQIETQRTQLESLVSQRRHQVKLAAAELGRVRQIESLHIDGRLPGWRRRDIDELIPVRRSLEALAHAKLLLQGALIDLAQVDLRQGETEWLSSQRHRLLTQRSHLYDQLAEHILRAPTSGVVRTQEPGALEGIAIVAGQGLVEISTSMDWQARLTVSAQDWGQVRPGQAARLFVEAYPHVRHAAIPAVVESISSKPEPGSSSEYALHLQIEPPWEKDLRLAEGMRVAAHIIIDEGSLIKLLSAWFDEQFQHARPLQARRGLTRDDE